MAVPCREQPDGPVFILDIKSFPVLECPIEVTQPWKLKARLLKLVSLDGLWVLQGSRHLMCSGFPDALCTAMSFPLNHKLFSKSFLWLPSISPGSQHPDTPLGELPRTPRGMRNLSLHLRHLLSLTDFLP